MVVLCRRDIFESMKDNGRGGRSDEIEFLATRRHKGVIIFAGDVPDLHELDQVLGDGANALEEKVQETIVLDARGNVFGQGFFQEQASVQVDIIKVASLSIFRVGLALGFVEIGIFDNGPEPVVSYSRARGNDVSDSEWREMTSDGRCDTINMVCT